MHVDEEIGCKQNRYLLRDADKSVGYIMLAELTAQGRRKRSICTKHQNVGFQESNVLSQTP